VALETRANDRKYFYRSTRVDDKVVKQYIASGQKAQIAAEAHRKAREESAAARAAERRELEQINAAFEPLAAFENAFETVLEAALSASGYVCRKGQWRKQYGQGSCRSSGANAGAVA
jgi:hypothetical protein